MSSPIRRAFARRDASTEPRLDLQSWGGALIVMIGVGAIVWVVQIVNAARHYSFDRFGLEPRVIGGMWGILTEPFLHASYGRLLSNTLPLLAIGWVLMLSGVRIWLAVTAWVVIIGGALTWMLGPSDTVILGASGMIFGWLGYLLGRAVFTRQLKWIITAAMVLLFFGTLLGGVLPSFNSNVSWQAQLLGFVAGFAFAALLLPRRVRKRPARRTAVS